MSDDPTDFGPRKGAARKPGPDDALEGGEYGGYDGGDLAGGAPDRAGEELLGGEYGGYGQGDAPPAGEAGSSDPPRPGPGAAGRGDAGQGATAPPAPDDPPPREPVRDA